MSQTAQRMLDSVDKRIATLQKSLDKKRRALKVQEELFDAEPRSELEDHPTYQYYMKELAAAEEAYEKKCRYYNDAIDALKSKLRVQKPQGKVYRRLEKEVEMEEKELEQLKREYQTISTTTNEMEVKKRQQEAIARVKEEERRAEEKRLADLEVFKAQKAAQAAADEARWAAQAEEEKKLQTPPPLPPTKKVTEGRLQRIQEAKTQDELKSIAEEKEPFDDEEEELWNKLWDEMDAKENAPEEKVENTIVSEPEPPKKSFDDMTLNELLALNCDPFTNVEMKLYAQAIKTKEAAKPKATPLPAPKPVAENSIVSGPPILKTTKMKAKTVGAPSVAPRPLGAYHQ